LTDIKKLSIAIPEQLGWTLGMQRTSATGTLMLLDETNAALFVGC